MRIIYIKNQCIYYNKTFWENVDEDYLISNYETLNPKDFLNNKMDFELFKVEVHTAKYFINSLDTIETQVLFNINVGKEFISLFREEFVRTPLKEMTSLEIAKKTANLIPLILTGSFREACDLLRLYEPDEFMTRERIDKYIAMLTSADAIDYNYEETI